MRAQAPFNRRDLEELDACFFAKADRVVALEDVYDGDRAPNVLGLRHDCDNAHSLATAVKMAHWEQERGYRSSYYILHTAPYWDYPDFEAMVYEIAECGHEIGLHNNALAESFRTGEDPDLIFERALGRLRNLGFPVRGSAGHGDHFCSYAAQPGEPWFANDELFIECRRVQDIYEDPYRLIWRGNIRRNLAPKPMSHWGLEYEALWLGHPYPFRFSDSGGQWVDPGWDEMVAAFAETVVATEPPQHPDDPRQLHILQHPDWWADAFQPARQAA